MQCSTGLQQCEMEIGGEQRWLRHPGECSAWVSCRCCVVGLQCCVLVVLVCRPKSPEACSRWLRQTRLAQSEVKCLDK